MRPPSKLDEIRMQTRKPAGSSGSGYSLKIHSHLDLNIRIRRLEKDQPGFSDLPLEKWVLAYPKKS